MLIYLSINICYVLEKEMFHLPFLNPCCAVRMNSEATEKCFKYTLYHGADVFLLSHDHIKFLNLRLSIGLPS